jgi:hypothetical protein
MNNPIYSSVNFPELGTLEDLVVALRNEDKDIVSETITSALALEEYRNLVNEVATLKGEPNFIQE